MLAVNTKCCPCRVKVMTKVVRCHQDPLSTGGAPLVKCADTFISKSIKPWCLWSSRASLQCQSPAFRRTSTCLLQKSWLPRTARRRSACLSFSAPPLCLQMYWKMFSGNYPEGKLHKNVNGLNGFCLFPAFSVALVHLLRSIWCLGERLDTWSTQTNRWFFEQLDTVLTFWPLLASNPINLPQCADEAMSVLNGRMVNGVRMKVMLADPPREESHKRLRTYWGNRRVSFLLQGTLVCF